jgi:Ran GTPase-activating protein (RanGAP) involved in mRNA processing and transport
MKELTENLANNSIDRLDHSNLPLGKYNKVELTDFGKALKLNTSVKTIELTSHSVEEHIDQELIAVIADSIVYSSVETLVLDNMHPSILNYSLDMISSAITYSTTIKNLSLSKNNLTDSGLSCLNNALTKNCSIEKLNLAHNNIGNNGLELLANILMFTDSRIKQLGLWNNHLPQSGLIDLIKVLNTNESLIGLDLSCTGLTSPTGINSAVVNQLAEVLGNKAKLEFLSLTENHLNDKAVELLISALHQNKLLKSLNLFDNQLTKDSAVEIFKALEKNKTLQVLNMGKNQLGDLGTIILARSFEKSETLEELDLSQNNPTDIGLTILSRMRQQDCFTEKILKL